MEECHRAVLNSYQCVTYKVHNYISEEKPCVFCSCSHLWKQYFADRSELATSSCNLILPLGPLC